jgi:hypothetical protein
VPFLTHASKTIHVLMAEHQTVTDFTANNRMLSVVSTNLHSNTKPEVPNSIQRIWKVVSTEIKKERQVAYIRDLPDSTVEGKYPGGYAPNEHEVFIALPGWPCDDIQLIDTLAHELHHLARWQNRSYGRSFGDILLTEGMASWFAQLQSGWSAPWIEEELSSEIWKRVEEEWANEEYNHGEWFFEGPLGKWVGYRVGYHLAKKLLKDSFDLRQSVLATAEQGKAVFAGS